MGTDVVKTVAPVVIMTSPDKPLAVVETCQCDKRPPAHALRAGHFVVGHLSKLKSIAMVSS